MDNHKDKFNSANELLPWYVNGTLSAEETALVEQCLAESEELQTELAALQKLAQAVQTESPVVPSAVKSFRKLQTQIDTSTADSNAAKPSALGEWLQKLRDQLTWVPAPAQAFAAIAVAVVLSLLVIGNDQPVDDFVTLSDPEEISAYADASSIIIVFNGDIAGQQLGQLVNEVSAAAVSGPNSVNAYQLYFANTTDRDQALAMLREKPELKLVEPVWK